MSAYPFKVCVEKLQVKANAGVDAWGRGKAQPTLVSIDISLKNHPEQAANTDAVDQSTIHYGQLSKTIASAVSSAATSWLSTEALIALLYRTGVPSLTNIGEAQMSVIYPKASKYGDGIRITTAMPDSTTVLHLIDLRIATLIGVNKHERGAKQPLLINMWLEPFKLSNADRHQELEERLVETVEGSSFDTLEALAFKIHNDSHVLARDMANEGAMFRIRIAKPLAIPDAEAPAIEMNWRL